MAEGRVAQIVAPPPDFTALILLAPGKYTFWFHFCIAVISRDTLSIYTHIANDFMFMLTELGWATLLLQLELRAPPTCYSITFFY